MSQKIKRGDIIDVKITGIQPYGAFASLPDNSTGLIHISEISDKFVKSIDSFVKVGESIKVKVIDFDEFTAPVLQAPFPPVLFPVGHARVLLFGGVAGRVNLT